MTSTSVPKLATEADREIGSRIAAVRAAQGLSQTTLGHAIGVSFQQVQKYEKGRNRIGDSRRKRIADQLKVPVETFFAGSKENNDRKAVVSAVFNDPKVVELAFAFTCIADQTTRDSVLLIVKAAATMQQERAAQA